MRYSSFLILLITIIQSIPSLAQIKESLLNSAINSQITAENVSLHIEDNFEAIRLDGASPFISFYDGLTYRGYLYMTSNNMYLINRSAGNLQFGTNALTRLTIDPAGKLGLGTSIPQVKLHVANGTIGTFNANTIAGFSKSSGNGYLSLLTNSSYESGILFGDQNIAEQGGIIYNSPATSKGLQFRTNGNTTRMVIDNQGDVGIGKTNPNRPLHVKSGNGGDEYGIMIERSGSSVDWEISVFGGNYNWFYDGGTTPVSRIEPDGTYSTSDRRLKKDIHTYKSILPVLEQFNIYSYQMLHGGPETAVSLGMMAQEIAGTFPEIVRYRPNRDGEYYYSIDYSKTGVLALKAIQELHLKLKEISTEHTQLLSTIDSLSQENEQLKDRMKIMEENLRLLSEKISAK